MSLNTNIKYQIILAMLHVPCNLIIFAAWSDHRRLNRPHQDFLARRVDIELKQDPSKRG